MKAAAEAHLGYELLCKDCQTHLSCDGSSSAGDSGCPVVGGESRDRSHCTLLDGSIRIYQAGGEDLQKARPYSSRKCQGQCFVQNQIW